jgi:hypothetical protein
MAKQPSIETYARKLYAIEDTISKQQSVINKLEQDRELWTSQIQNFLDNTFFKAQNARGSKGQDILAITSFMGAIFTEAVKRLQDENENIIKNSLPFTKFQEIEKRLLSRPSSNEEVAALEARIQKLEAQQIQLNPNKEEQQEQQEQQYCNSSEIVISQNTQEIDFLKKHVLHLEETLIKEVQRAYKTVHRPGDYGAPLGKIQAQVDHLTQDIISIKRSDGQKLAETFLTTGVATMREEFQRKLDEKATIQEWAGLQERLDGIEQFSRDVQVQVLRTHASQKSFESAMAEQFSDQKWEAIQKKLEKRIDDKLREATQLLNHAITEQKARIEVSFAKADAAVASLEREVKIHYGPDMLQHHINIIRNEIVQYSDKLHEKHVESTTRKLTGFLDELQVSKRTFLEISSEVSKKLAAANLTERFREFEERAEKYNSILDNCNIRITEVNKLIETEKEHMNSRKNTLAGYNATIIKAISDLEARVRDEQKNIRTSLDEWCESRKHALNISFSQLQLLGERLSAKLIVSEHTLEITHEKRKEFQETLEKDYSRKYESLSSAITDKFKKTEDYVISRVSELSTATQKIGQTISEQKGQLEALLSERTLGEFVSEIERRVKTSQDNWTRRRTQMIDSRLDEFNRVMELMIENTKSATERHEVVLAIREENIRNAQIEQVNRLITQTSAEVETLRRSVEQTLKAQTKACSEAITAATEMQLAYQKKILDTARAEKDNDKDDSQGQVRRWLTDLKSSMRLPTTVRTSKEVQQQLWYTATTKCFYTAIIGTPGMPHDVLSTITPIAGWDYICFTNLDLPETTGWRIQKVEYDGTTPTVEAKRYKWLSHIYLVDYDIVVWMDAYLGPNPSYQLIFYNWIQHMKEKSIYIMHRPHGERICIWEECKAVIKNRRDTPEHVRAVEKVLRESKMPKDWGLFDTNIIVKFNKDLKTQEVSEDIVKQIETISPRDQLAVSYIYFLKEYTTFKQQNLMNAFQPLGEHVRIPAT